MASRSILYRLMSNRRLHGAWAVLVLLCSQAALCAQVARLNLNHSDVSGNLTITLSADTVSSWTDQDRLVVLLKGQVFIKQGLIQGRMQNAVVWVDTATKEKTGSYALEVYGEGNVSLLDGSNNVTGGQPGSQVLFLLSTRGEVKANVYAGLAGTKAQTNDSVYLRAQAARTGPARGPQCP